MRKSRAVAAILSTFILCSGLACCSADDEKGRRDDVFSFGHNDVILEETTTAQQSTEEEFTNLTQDSSESLRTSESDSETAASTTASKRPTFVFRTTQPTTKTPAVNSTTSPSTAPPTTKTPRTTLPPEIEFDTTRPTTAPVSDEEDIALETEVLRLVNAEREKKGLSPLTFSKELAAAADVRTRELTITFSHTRPNGMTCFTVSEYVFAENIASGQTAPQSVVSAWMNSSGHKDNILNEKYKTAAVGCYRNEGTYYWVLLFGY